jgi:hypothetical protein
VRALTFGRDSQRRARPAGNTRSVMLRARPGRRPSRSSGQGRSGAGGVLPAAARTRFQQRGRSRGAHVSRLAPVQAKRALRHVIGEERAFGTTRPEHQPDTARRARLELDINPGDCCGDGEFQNAGRQGLRSEAEGPRARSSERVDRLLPEHHLPVRGNARTDRAFRLRSSGCFSPVSHPAGNRRSLKRCVPAGQNSPGCGAAGQHPRYS